MTLEDLRVLTTVAAERSFSRAARKLRRTQPAVSQAIRRLEQASGEVLIDRSRRDGTLTDAGLRSHEAFAPDPAAGRRRSRRYAAASVVLVIALVGGAVAARVAKDGREPFVNSVTKQVQPYWQALVRKAGY